jgi:hypothetical protein
MSSLLIIDGSASAPPSKRPRQSGVAELGGASLDARLLCGPVSFTAAAPRPRIYMLPMAARAGGWPQERLAAAAATLPPPAPAAGAAAAAASPSSADAAAHAQQQQPASAAAAAAQAPPPAELSMCIPIVRRA